jgi:glutamyl-tRNA reductase
VSISSAAAEFSAYTLAQTSQGVLKDMSEAKIVILGAGKMARLLLIHLQTQGVKGVTVVNRYVI